jgi:hypothetical protein
LAGGDEPEVWGKGVTRKNEVITMRASAPPTLLDAVENYASYPFTSSSSSLRTMEIDISYPSINGSEYVIDANIKGRYNFVIEYIYIPLFYININYYFCVVRQVCVEHVLHCFVFEI